MTKSDQAHVNVCVGMGGCEKAEERGVDCGHNGFTDTILDFGLFLMTAGDGAGAPVAWCPLLSWDVGCWYQFVVGLILQTLMYTE